MDVEQMLAMFGLTPAEVQVYLALVKAGEAKAGDIIKTVGVSSSNVHAALQKLITRGLASSKVRNGIRHYLPASPAALQGLIDAEKDAVETKERELAKLIPKIASLKTVVQPAQDAEVYVGLQAVKSAYARLFEHKQGEFKFFYKYDPATIETVHKFFAKMDIQDYYRTIPTKAIFSKEYEKLLKTRLAAKFNAKCTNTPIPSSINIYNGKTLMIAWGEKPVAFLIHSEEIAKMYETLFDQIWAQS